MGKDLGMCLHRAELTVFFNVGSRIGFGSDVYGSLFMPEKQMTS